MSINNILEMAGISAFTLAGCAYVKRRIRKRDERNYIRGCNETVRALNGVTERWRDMCIYYGIKYAESIGDGEMMEKFIKMRDRNKLTGP